MSTNARFQLLLAVTASLSLNLSTASAQSFDAAHVSRNQALAATPRALEAYPWLTPRSGKAPVALARKSKALPAAVQPGTALAATPRILEEFPQLSRATTAAPTPSGTSYATHPTRNEAVAASPRILEEFPELSRPASAPRAQPTYEIAPLK